MALASGKMKGEEHMCMVDLFKDANFLDRTRSWTKKTTAWFDVKTKRFEHFI